MFCSFNAHSKKTFSFAYTKLKKNVNESESNWQMFNEFIVQSTM